MLNKQQESGVVLGALIGFVLVAAVLGAGGSAEHTHVLWHADAEAGGPREWAAYSTARHCGVLANQVRSDASATRVRRPRAQGAYAYRFAVGDASRCYGERSELGQALPSRPGFTDARLFRDGDDRWISFQVRLARDFPVGVDTWNVIAQFKQVRVPAGGPASPALALQVRDGEYLLVTSTRHGGAAFSLGRAVRERWARFTMHVKFSPARATGLAEVWGDPDGAGMRRLLPPMHMATLIRSDAGRPIASHTRIGIYRDAAIPGVAHLFFDGYCVAVDRVAAERSAFAAAAA
jgi:hypothetical protein